LLAGQSLFCRAQGAIPGIAILRRNHCSRIYAANRALCADAFIGPKGQSVPLISDPTVDTAGTKQDE